MHTSSSSTQVERSNNLSHLCHKRSNPCLEQSHSQARCSRPYPVNFCVFPRMEVPHLSGPFPASACTHFPHSTHQKKKKPTQKTIVFLWNVPSCNLCALHYHCCQLHKSPDTSPAAEQLFKMQVKDSDVFLRWYRPRTSGSAVQGARAIKGKKQIPFKQSGLWQAEAWHQYSF